VNAKRVEKKVPVYLYFPDCIITNSWLRNPSLDRNILPLSIPYLETDVFEPMLITAINF